MDGRRVRAIYRPVRIDDLKPEAKAMIGEEYIFDQAWEIEPEDGGPYVGQDAWTIWSRPGGSVGVDIPRGVGWVPTEDLHVVEALSKAWTS